MIAKEIVSKHNMQLQRTLRGQVVNTERPIETEDPKIISRRAKLEVFGEEMLVKEVKISGKSGRIYLPPEWIGKHVKIIRID
jgi:putative transposon-encoded protein